MKLSDMALPGSCLSGLLAVGALFSTQALAESSNVATDESAIESEVVVTARRIAEDPQDVPVSVQVLSGEYLDESRTTRLHELQFAIPGLVVNTVGMFGVGLAMRGISDQSIGGLSVAPHLNGVYLGDANAAIARLFDIERIEVLKGPQGTLYGRNATGGTINVITRAPQDSPDSEIEVAYGSFETARAQGYLNLPLTNSAMRFAFIASEGDGYIRNSVDNRRFAEDDYWGLRGSYRIDVGDALHVDVMAQHIRDDGGSGDLWSPRPAFLPDPHDIRLTTVTLENPYLISEIDNLNVTLEDELGFATLRSITGYVRSEVRNVDDCAGFPPLEGCVRSALPNDFDQWSQEFQLSFPRSGAVEGNVGAYYADADAVQDLYQLIPLQSTLPLSDSHSTFSNRASALFGQATVYFADRWSTTAGLRMSWDKQDFTTIGTGVGDSPTLLVGKSEADDLSWLLNLKYTVRDGLMVYAAVSTGHKNGGSNDTPVNGEPDVYKPEYLTAFETGGKSQWLSGRLTLNAAAFLYDYDDLQVTTGNLDFRVENAAKAQIYGIDADMNYIVSERWSVSGGVVWVPKREFVEFENEGTTFSGNELVRAPEWSAVGAVGYERPLNDFGSLSLRLEYSYRSGYFYTPENDPRLAQGSYGLLNAYLRFEAASNAWYAFLSGRNLTDEDYYNQVFIQSSPGYPDTYEIGVGIRF